MLVRECKFNVFSKSLQLFPTSILTQIPALFDLSPNLMDFAVSKIDRYKNNKTEQIFTTAAGRPKVPSKENRPHPVEL